MGRAARIAATAAAIAVVAGTAVAAPRLAQINRDNQARDSREAAAAKAAAKKRVREEQRPRRATVKSSRGPELLATLESRITTDARTRRGLGRVRRVECRTPDRAGARRVRYACTAVTSDVVTASGDGHGVIGYPYRALVERGSGHLTWCKVAGSAGEGSFNPRNRTPVPRACGG